jgi:hypothetical protein
MKRPHETMTAGWPANTVRFAFTFCPAVGTTAEGESVPEAVLSGCGSPASSDEGLVFKELLHELAK